ncbi:MAG: thioester domain-containing protein, partial [Oscillospiraceae bacterium]|nr:thioester domain-containing protein [Oscillospiraceae bacterium]
MKKKLRAALSLTLAVIMCLSLSVGAFADTVTVSDTIQVETTAGKNEAVDVTITIESTNNADGTTTTETTTEANDFVTGDGMTVDYSANSTEIKDAKGNLLPGSNSDSSWNAVNGDGSYTSEGGSDSKVVENSGTGTVDVSMTVGGIDTAYGEAAGTTVTTGDVKESPDDGIYDYTTETVLQQGSVKVETTKVEVGVDEVKSEYKSDLKYVTSDAETTADNDMINLNYQQDIPTKENMPEAEDGYQFVLVGNHKASQFWAQYVYTKPQCEDDIVAFTLTDENGNEQKYYYGRGPGGYYHSCYNAEGVYIDGEKVSDDTVRAGWGILEQFLLIDPATGKAVTTYCADIATSTQDGFSYNIENVEDAEYYSEEQAAMIRTVAFNGYWGTESGTGSLEAVKQMMRDAKEDGKPVFTEEEINSLTDGIAMTATQYAIWKFSNSMSEIEFINCQFTSKDEN